ncbi:uncharacterized protein LOC132927610 isoform X2 [Rhopalosiphum padi]|uniref:uncharacterized protein LOC132927610 isoform X2 n=1 Tax=Rhopalosiphum padi TaxID=40932 RepID=UPI00298D7DAC|nr:uncharacterized protein LOC132927610 isoform X2 [Rhopalosiphum padi]
MPSPRSVVATGQDELNDYDLDDLGCTLDIVHEIDKFLEGLTDGADLPVNNDKKNDEIKTADLEVIDNKRTSITPMDVEFVGKDSAVFQLLEDNENYGVYEHNPNECNWNVFYKTLPPDEQAFVKVEPKTEIINDYCTSDSENKLESFSFNLDNTLDTPDNLSTAEVKRWKPYKKFKHNSKNNTAIPHLFRNNNYKNTFRKPNPWYRKDSTERNNVFQQTFKNQHQGNSSLLSVPNNNNSTFFPPRTYNLQSNRGNSNNFKKIPNEIQGNQNVAKDNFQFVIPKYTENPTVNTPRQLHLPPVPPVIKPHSIVGEYLCPVSLVGTTIKFLSRKLANTSIREQIIVELATHGVLENNWWTPDDMFYATFSERSVAQHVFKLYPHNSKSSY